MGKPDLRKIPASPENLSGRTAGLSSDNVPDGTLSSDKTAISSLNSSSGSSGVSHRSGSAAKTKTTTKRAVEQSVDEVDKLASSLIAKQQFVASTFNMGWRLAITVVIPLVAGVKLDEKFHSAPSYTITGLFIAAFAGCMAVWTTVKQVNEEQAEQMAELTSKRGKK